MAAQEAGHAKPENATKPRVVVTIEGGVIQDVCANDDVEVLVIDYDTEGALPDELTQVDQGDVEAGEPSYADAFVRMEHQPADPAAREANRKYVEGRFAAFMKSAGKRC